MSQLNQSGHGLLDDKLAGQKVNELYLELHENLDKLIRVYRMLLDSIRRERDLLIEVNISELDENNKSKEAALKKLRRLEHDRVHIVRLLAKELAVKDEPVRLLDIAAKFSGDERSEVLRKKHSVLELLVKRVMENNRKNEELAQSALLSVSGALESIKETVAEKPTYARKGELKGQGASGHLVRREA